MKKLWVLVSVGVICAAANADVHDTEFLSQTAPSAVQGRSAHVREEAKQVQDQLYQGLKPGARLEIGLLTSGIRYREKNSGAFFMEQDGSYSGFDLRKTWYGSHVMTHVNGTYQVGKMDYKSHGTGFMHDIDDRLWEAQSLIGWSWNGDSYRVTPFLGLGYRFLSDDSVDQHSTTGAFGYLREANYHYVPFGVMFDAWENEWRTTGSVEYDWLIYGDQYSYIDSTDPFHNRQYNGYGWKARLQFSHHLSGRGRWYIAPFANYWHIRDSEVDCKSGYGCGVEPNNFSRQVGIEVGLEF